MRSGPCRLCFFSHAPNEPPHIHVDRENLSTKFCLDPVALARDLGFGARELRDIEALVYDHQAELLEAWHDYFGT
jgi:hypothetical protein